MKDDEISVISSVERKKLYTNFRKDRRQTGRKEWHSDITFEPIPSDYTLLRLTELPTTGGGEIQLYFLFLIICEKLTKF